MVKVNGVQMSKGKKRKLVGKWHFNARFTHYPTRHLRGYRWREL